VLHTCGLCFPGLKPQSCLLNDREQNDWILTTHLSERTDATGLRLLHNLG
jgi:hypothetical protein